MNKVYLLLGSNMGDSKKQLELARKQIHKHIGIIKRQSALYQTAAWGNRAQPDFLNQVVLCISALPAPAIMQIILTIEAQMGRVRTQKNAPRIIDIDILYYEKQVINEPTLVVPHPAIAQRRFVLAPLNELSPLFIHPVYQKTNHAMLVECSDALGVKKI